MKFAILLLLLGIIPLLDLFQPGLPITHDGQDHVARIANFYANLTEGNIIPRWAGNLNWGYGHPILMFLYPFPSYFASFFHFLGFTLVDSVKIVFGVSFILSGIFMYLWLKEFLPDWASFVGGLLYMYAPYRFVDLYVRGAIGEHVAFIFLPVILFFIHRVSKENNNFYIAGGSLALAGLILSHNAISIMFFPVILFYSLFLFFKNKGKRLLIYKYSSILVLGLSLAAFFWVPAYFEGKYTLRDIVTSEDYKTRFVELKDLIHGTWNYGISGQFSVQVGILHWIFVALSIPLLILRKNNLLKFSLSILIIFLLSLLLMHSSSKIIWDNISTIQKFQFPWRFLSITVFASSILGALVISQIDKKYKISVLILAVFFSLFLNKDYWHAKDYQLKPESFYEGIYNSTTDTGESSPVWSVRFMLNRPKAHLETIAGNARISEAKRTSTYHEYRVEVLERTKFRENTLYFPGWEVFVDGKKTDVEFQDQLHRGLMTFWVDPSTQNISVRFAETKLRLFSNLTSLLSALIIGLLIISKLRIRI
jgi:hypothetical protein